jgi:PAS domain S-box-containing protein
LINGMPPWSHTLDQPSPYYDHDHGQRYWRTPVTLPQALGDLTPQRLDGEFRLLADYLPMLCWIAQSDGYIVWYNRRWHDYCGTTPAAMEGWGWQTVHDPRELPVVLDRWKAAIASGQPFEMIFPLRGEDGIFRPFLTRIVPVRDNSGAIVRWLGVNTEIGDQVAAETRLSVSEAKYDILTEAMPQMVWSTLPDGHHDYYNAQWYAFTGVPQGSTDGEAWNGMFHPDDQARAWAQWRHCLQTGAPYEIEYRLRHHSGAYRWTLGRALPVRDPAGTIVRWIGTCTDIDAAKRQAEQTEVLTHELSHRIKNIFAVIAGLIRISARHHAELKPLTNDLVARIAALGRAHEFARPHSEASKPAIGATTLKGLLEQLLSPYLDSLDGQITISGDDIPLDDRGATPLALVIHELATNAAKYGALSVASGRLDLRIARHGDNVDITWVERGGPVLQGPPQKAGFGTLLTKMSVVQQLDGEITRDWQPEGLVVGLGMKAAALSRG